MSYSFSQHSRNKILGQFLPEWVKKRERDEHWMKEIVECFLEKSLQDEFYEMQCSQSCIQSRALLAIINKKSAYGLSGHSFYNYSPRSAFLHPFSKIFEKFSVCWCVCVCEWVGVLAEQMMLHINSRFVFVYIENCRCVGVIWIVM